MDIATRHIVAGVFLLTGFITAAASLVVLWRRERGVRTDVPDVVDGAADHTIRRIARRHRGALAVVAAFAVFGAVAAFEGIDRRGMSHVEVYVPGIVLPPEISEPPARLGIVDAVWWHVHSEPHPPGYYLLMWGWTKVFGTSLLALRSPSVLFGALAVLLTFFVATRLYGPLAGVLAAGLLALNGHHVYWMQQARMYELSLLLALLSVWFWIDVLQSSSRRPSSEGGYLATTVAGVYTQMYFWPLLAAQMITSVLSGSLPKGRLHRAFSLQVLVVILGAPLWAHAVYQARNEPTDSTSVAFGQDMFNFAFLFTPDWRSAPLRDIPWAAEALLTLIGIALLAMFAVRGRRWSAVPSPPSIPASRLLIPAIGMALINIGWSFEVNQRPVPVAMTGAVPLIAVAGLAVFGSDSPVRRLRGRWGRETRWASPIPGVVIGVIACTFALGLVQPFLTSRGFLVIVPMLLILFAVGLAELLGRWRVAGTVLALLLAAGHGWSIAYYHSVPGANDYRGLAEQLQIQLQDDDLILVRRRDWVTTPIFYHLQGRHGQLVARDFQTAIEQTGVQRVWVLQFSDVPLPPAMVEAVSAMRPARQLESFRSRAILYTRDTATSTGATGTVVEAGK